MYEPSESVKDIMDKYYEMWTRTRTKMGKLDWETRKFQKRLPTGSEGVYEENLDFRGEKTNRIDKGHKVYWLLLSQISPDNSRKYVIQ